MSSSNVLRERIRLRPESAAALAAVHLIRPRRATKLKIDAPGNSEASVP
jgi:hypothetical protein